MSDDRDPGSEGPETGGFDADEWFRTQFGEQPPAAPSAEAVPPSPEPVPPAPEPAPPTPPPTAASPTPPPAAPPTPPPAAPSYPPLASPPMSAPPPTSAPIALPPPPGASSTPDSGPLQPPPLMAPPLMPPPPAAAPVPFEPSATEPMQVVDDPTVALSAADLPAVDQPAVDQSGRPAGDAATELMRTPEEGGALDELFGSDEPLIPVVPRRAAAGEGGAPPPRAPLTKNQKVLLWIAGSLVALLALVALFFVGTRIPDLLGPAPGAEPSPTPTPTPTPTETERPIGPVPPGDYRWDELWGGECLEPFTNAWQDEFTVVDCGVPHGGQLVARLPFPLPEGATEQGPYPGEEVLAGQIAILCSAPGVIDLSAAGTFTDIQLQGAYAVTEEEWDDGQQDYFCFVSRSSGEPLTRSLAVAPAPPAG